MSRPGVNMAVTSDGAAYNKLRRPDMFASPTQSPGESSKRKHDGSEIYDERPYEKRIKNTTNFQNSLSADPRRISRPIRENGMQTMFPGLDGEEDIEDETMQEALAYLRSVRSEASTIPPLLVAEPESNEDEEDRTMYNDGRGDHRACYVDGTWVSVDDPGYSDDEGSYSSEDIDPQDGYYKSLLARYKKLQNQLVNSDPQELAALIHANPEKYAKIKMPSRRDGWLHTFENEYPTPMFARGISESNLFGALEFFGESLSHSDTISRQKSCWIWTLLARVGDRGTLDYTKIGRIRELGRRAGQFGVWLREGDQDNSSDESENGEVEEWVVDGAGTDGEEGEFSEAVNGQNHITETSKPAEPDAPLHVSKTEIGLQVDGADDGDAADAASDDEGEIQEEPDHDEVSDLEAARASLLAQLGDRLVQPSGTLPPNAPSDNDMEDDDSESDPVDLNTRVTIDMILTVVAECYGQKDLLGYREAW
ncbi:hypothetical protein DM02DRAFT_539218 [Periconia macrospinosa]|uniref:Uncharacterized protein n=1 Tax=Periconia macrospinosa TaxID=97972 RepID=A0A2V1D8U3_9PLEO|nr:hypothetical protein DM02DRAFT_539218 [Periconia macrospinosa]